ncbi:putative lipoprotein [Pseudoalteromonas luteoviolacea B = ATCC 29581]|nr:putative lipoprotein [Pseudoalteromonas luteoviolacea B = ATCC 29581]
MKKLLTSIGLSFLSTVVWSSEAGAAATQSISNCKVGIYTNKENVIVVTKRGEGYRYMYDQGAVGIVGDDQVLGCDARTLSTYEDGLLNAVNIRVTDTRFVVDGVTLVGQLIEPENVSERSTLIVYAHGSEESGWLEQASDPYQMVARGISVFVYDKRGTGLSEGNYSQNFPQLAKDLVAASKEAKNLAKGRFERFGLVGLSQGGWIAPLAAEKAEADFIAIGYGLVVDILEEDAAQVQLELLQAGYGGDVIMKAKTITDVTALVASSGYTKGLQELDELRQLYANEDWFKRIKGGYSGVILSMSSNELRSNGIPMFDRLNIDWSLVPLEVLRKVNVPQFWILAGEDREAPIEKTMERLKTLRSEGKPIQIHVFPNTDHGMWEFQEQSNGVRQYTKVTAGFHDLLADWLKSGQVKNIK